MCQPKLYRIPWKRPGAPQSLRSGRERPCLGPEHPEVEPGAALTSCGGQSACRRPARRTHRTDTRPPSPLKTVLQPGKDFSQSFPQLQEQLWLGSAERQWCWHRSSRSRAVFAALCHQYGTLSLRTRHPSHYSWSSAFD